MTDQQLLEQYHRQGDHDAFAQIVSRHGRLVYATAWRLAPADAQDIAQGVFLLLSQKAGAMGAAPSLAGWLHRATCYCAANALKVRRRREHYEREAAAMRSGIGPSDSHDLQEVLDGGLAAIGDGYRQVLLLRYLEGLSLEETAERLAISVPAVAKRAERGLMKLRKVLRAEEVSAASLGAVMAEEATRGVPEGLLGKLVASSEGSAGQAVRLLAAGAKKGFLVANMVAAAKVAAIVLVIGGAGLMAAGAARGTQGGAIVNEADPAAPGSVRLVRDIVWVEENVATAIRAAGEPVETKSQWFSAMLVPTDALHRALALATRRAESHAQTEMRGLFSGEPKLIWDGYGPSPAGVGIGKNRGLVANIRPGQGGKHDLQTRPGGLAMHLDMPGLTAEYLLPTGPHEMPAAIAFEGEVPGGMALVFLGGFENEGVYCVDAWEAVRMTRTQTETLRAMGGGEWFNRTPAEWRSYAERLYVWQSKGTPLEKRDQLTQRLDGGMEVQLLAISRPEKWPGCWWTPRGKPIADASGEAEHARLAAAVRFVTAPAKKDGDAQDQQKWGSVQVVYLHKWDNTNGSMTFPCGEERVFVLPDESGTLSFDLASSTWQRLGTLDERHPLSAGDTVIEAAEVTMPMDTMCAVRLKYNHLRDAAVRLVALDEAGNELGNAAIGDAVRLAGSARRGENGEVNCTIFNIKGRPARFAVEVAPYRHVEFSGFATAPAVAPPDTVSATQVQEVQATADDRQTKQIVQQWNEAKAKYDAIPAGDSTPQGLFKRMLESAESGRTEDVVGCFVPTADVPQKQQVQDFAHAIVAEAQCGNAAVTKFGLEQIVRDKVKLPVLGKYDCMVFDWHVEGARATASRMSMQRMDGHWRLEPAGLVEKRPKYMEWARGLELITAGLRMDGSERRSSLTMPAASCRSCEGEFIVAGETQLGWRCRRGHRPWRSVPDR